MVLQIDQRALLRATQRVIGALNAAGIRCESKREEWLNTLARRWADALSLARRHDAVQQICDQIAASARQPDPPKSPTRQPVAAAA